MAIIIDVELRRIAAAAWRGGGINIDLRGVARCCCGSATQCFCCDSKRRARVALVVRLLHPLPRREWGWRRRGPTPATTLMWPAAATTTAAAAAAMPCEPDADAAATTPVPLP